MGHSSIGSKGWVVQLTLEHGIGVLCCSLARDLAVLYFHIVVLDLLLVAVFKVGCVTLVSEQIFCLGLCLQCKRVLWPHLVVNTGRGGFASYLLSITRGNVWHLLAVLLSKKVFRRIFANNHIFLGPLEVYIWRTFAVWQLVLLLTGVIVLLVAEIDGTYLI